MKESFHPYAITSVLCWSVAYVFTRLSLRYITPLSLGFLRYSAASLALIIFLALLKIRPPAKKDWLWFLLSGLSGFGLYIAIFNIGAASVTAATSSVIIAFVPVLTALLAFAIYKEKLALHQWLAIAIEFLGIVILTLYEGVFTANIGILWLISAAVLVSVYNIIQRRLLRTYTALQSTSYSILIGTAFLLIFAPASMKELAHAPAVIIMYIVALGVFSSAIAYISWSKAFEKAENTSVVSNYMFFTPLLTSIFGVWLAGEFPSVPTLVGGAIIILGAIIFNWQR